MSTTFAPRTGGILTATATDGTEVAIDLDSSYLTPVFDEVYVEPREGGGYRAAWLVVDQDAERPEFDGDVWIEVPEDRDYIRSYAFRWGAVREAREAIREYGRKRVYLVSVEDHGYANRYRLTDKFEDARYVLVIPEDCTTPDEYAAATVGEVDEWAQGNVFGVIVREVDADGVTIDPMEDCWGFIGTDYAESEAKASALGSR